MSEKESKFINTLTGILGSFIIALAIGTQVWMREDLKETRYRNGDLIPELQDNTSWINATSGARCYYIIP